MIPTPDNDPKLERIIHQTLRDLPLRRAPHSLEQRVFAEIQRRAGLAWWRRSFGYWPLAAQAAFIVLSAGLVKFALMLGMWVMAGFDDAKLKEAVAQPVVWLENVLVVVRSITGFFEVIFRNIPSLWIYGGLLFFAAMYVTLFGLGAAAYKAIRAQRSL